MYDFNTMPFETTDKRLFCPYKVFFCSVLAAPAKVLPVDINRFKPGAPSSGCDRKT